MVTKSDSLGQIWVCVKSVWCLARRLGEGGTCSGGTQCGRVMDELNELARGLVDAAEAGTAAHEVERTWFRKVLEMGRRMFGAFLGRVGTGDLGETTELPDGRVVRVGRRSAVGGRRLGEPRVRALATVFGRFAVSRCVYGTDEHHAFACIPTDGRLQLPEGNVSDLLPEWDQWLEIDQAFSDQAFSVARDTLNTILHIQQSVDTLEQGSRQRAEAAPAFREQQAAPAPTEEGELRIVTEDNQGVPMVRPTHAPPPGAHLTQGPNKNKNKNKNKRACLGAVSSVDRHVRTPEELVQTRFRDEGRFVMRTARASHHQRPRRNGTGPASAARSRGSMKARSRSTARRKSSSLCATTSPSAASRARRGFL